MKLIPRNFMIPNKDFMKLWIFFKFVDCIPYKLEQKKEYQIQWFGSSESFKTFFTYAWGHSNSIIYSSFTSHRPILKNSNKKKLFNYKIMIAEWGLHLRIRRIYCNVFILFSVSQSLHCWNELVQTRVESCHRTIQYQICDQFSEIANM